MDIKKKSGRKRKFKSPYGTEIQQLNEEEKRDISVDLNPDQRAMIEALPEATKVLKVLQGQNDEGLEVLISSDTIQIKLKSHPLIKNHIHKSLIKIAYSFLPEDELKEFDWIPQYLLSDTLPFASEEFYNIQVFSSFTTKSYVAQGAVAIFLRRSDKPNLPQIVFSLSIAGKTFFVHIPSNSDIQTLISQGGMMSFIDPGIAIQPLAFFIMDFHNKAQEDTIQRLKEGTVRGLDCSNKTKERIEFPTITIGEKKEKN